MQPVQNSSIVDDTIPRRPVEQYLFTAIVLIRITIAPRPYIIVENGPNAGNLPVYPTYVSSNIATFHINPKNIIYKRKINIAIQRNVS